MKLDLTIYVCSLCKHTDLSAHVIERHIQDNECCKLAYVAEYELKGLDVNEQITMENYIDVFLHSSTVKLDPSKLCREDTLRRVLSTFATRNGIEQPSGWSTVKRVLAKYNISRVELEAEPCFLGLHLDTQSTDACNIALSIEAFLESSDVVFDPTKYCPFDDFKEALKMFENQNGYRGSKYTADFFRSPFAKFNISKTRDQMEYRGRSLKRDYLLGVDLVHPNESL